MCQVADIKNCEKKVVITLTDGTEILSDWFKDIEAKIDESAVNRTVGERKVYEDMIRSYEIEESKIMKWYIMRKREEDTIYISEHAMQRLKERNGWNKETAMRMLKKVCDKGKRETEIKGYLSKWIKDKISNNNKGDYYILYGEYLYVFNYKTLVTVFNVPKKTKVLAKN